MSAPGRWVICDRCDAREVAGVAAIDQGRIARLQQAGWQITQGPNYCPACVKVLKYEREGR